MANTIISLLWWAGLGFAVLVVHTVITALMATACMRMCMPDRWDLDWDDEACWFAGFCWPITFPVIFLAGYLVLFLVQYVACPVSNWAKRSRSQKPEVKKEPKLKWPEVISSTEDYRELARLVRSYEERLPISEREC